MENAMELSGYVFMRPKKTLYKPIKRANNELNMSLF
jgi:hypothetical protein